MADLAGAYGQRKEFKAVGHPNLPGKLSYALATGIAKFGVDYVVPTMLHAKFLRSPYAHARVKSIDISKGRQLLEDYFFDKKTGVKLNANMFDYKKPTMLDATPVDLELLQTRLGNAAYGSNGISHSLADTHLVICAIQNAIGKWVDPPATPDKVLKALGKA